MWVKSQGRFVGNIMLERQQRACRLLGFVGSDRRGVRWWGLTWMENMGEVAWFRNTLVVFTKSRIRMSIYLVFDPRFKLL